MAKKYYAVKAGRKPGIYESWDECKALVTGFKGAIYKSFTSLEEAKAFMEIGYETATGTKAPSSNKANNENVTSPETVDDNYAFVDGSFNIATGVYGYGGFLIVGKEKYVLQGSGSDKEMASMRNVSGEILGSMAAIKKAIELGLSEVYIYFDYMGIRAWALGEWKRNKTGTIKYYDYIQSVKDKIDIHFIKVKGHSGVEGNEEADKLAKAAVGIQ
ncbi:viroplasmin family protein [Lachnospira multipara]|jgi:ribonuclease HI|uniref:Ribonuclease H n=1 Tax=Lachnospira multipara TaxID=28051 RepID=A0A1H5WPM4_9FIRM|nr:ribonuclease H family protein [Lachnospira multipara]MBQ2473436.1 ribonuclease H family protein [Lachnospira sp.]SEG01301.1 ribonuclease HI [Lachnospira multipara]